MKTDRHGMSGSRRFKDSQTKAKGKTSREMSNKWKIEMRVHTPTYAAAEARADEAKFLILFRETNFGESLQYIRKYKTLNLLFLGIPRFIDGTIIFFTFLPFYH